MKQYEEITSHRHGDQTQVIDLANPNSIVLDVGCSSGTIASRLISKGCKVYGIDYDNDALLKAKKYCVDVFSADLDALKPLPYKKNQFDLIILSNILEHLKYPKELVLQLNPHLKESGRIIVVLPNIGHGWYRLKHLLGKFDYADCGIMDKTHLHFYTLMTAQELLNDCGLEIIKTDFTISGAWLPIIKDNSKMQDAAYYLTKIRPTLFSPQFVFLCRKRNNPKLKLEKQ
jgi:methionine biosynthesis protein MetW